MKIVSTTSLISAGQFPGSVPHERAMKDVAAAIAAVKWPPGASIFTIYPQSGKRRGEGNGVGPIKQAFVQMLSDLGWRLEERYRGTEAEHEAAHRPGAFDAWLDLSADGWPAFVAEWETGNISSSHRALNKMAMGLLQEQLAGGVLVVPTRALYRYLTDRVGNYQEIAPYFPLWSALPIRTGFLAVIAVEHDATSTSVPRIGKATNGRALM